CKILATFSRPFLSNRNDHFHIFLSCFNSEKMRPGFIIKPAAFPHITRVTRTFWVLKPVLASSCIKNVREGIRFQNNPVSSILKTCSGLYRPSSIIVLNVFLA
uniref:Uncharacterized protein n=1 Tax=Oryzias melastigma TaxID=30732 RepID=A0A3B3BMH9_ORYME